MNQLTHEIIKRERKTRERVPTFPPDCNVDGYFINYSSNKIKELKRKKKGKEEEEQNLEEHKHLRSTSCIN